MLHEHHSWKSRLVQSWTYILLQMWDWGQELIQYLLGAWKVTHEIGSLGWPYLPLWEWAAEKIILEWCRGMRQGLTMEKGCFLVLPPLSVRVEWHSKQEQGSHLKAEVKENQVPVASLQAYYWRLFKIKHGKLSNKYMSYSWLHFFYQWFVTITRYYLPQSH